MIPLLNRPFSQTIAVLFTGLFFFVLLPQNVQSENTPGNSLNHSIAFSLKDDLASGDFTVNGTNSADATETSVLQPGQGAVTGLVTDASTGEPLPGVTVILANTAIGAAADVNGRYTITRLPAGEQTLVVRYLGYVTLTLEVIVIPGETVELDVSLQPDVVLGEEVVIYAQALGQAQAIREQLGSNTIVNVVSEARLRELPDANAAESIGRLPGVSVLRDAGEGQKVAIRGMGPRFSSITIDGNKVPGTDGDRSVDLSMISPEMLAGIEVFKSIRPDMDADAIGGAVNFRMRGAPSETRYRFNLDGGYNNQLKGIGNYSGAFMGSQRFFNNRLGVMVSATAQQVDRSAHILGSSYEVLRDAMEDEPHAPIQVTGLQLTDRQSTRNRLGGGISLDWRLSNGSLFFNNTYNQQSRQDLTQYRAYSISNNRQEWRPRNTQREINTLTSTLSGQHDFSWVEVEWRMNRSVTSNETPYNHVAWFFENSALDIVGVDLSGGPQILPSLALNRTERAYLESLVNDISSQRQENLAASADITLPLSLGTILSGYFKFGGKHYNTSRDRDVSRHRVHNWEMHHLYNDPDPTSDFQWMLTANGRPSMMPFVTDPEHTHYIIDGEYEMAHLPNIAVVDGMWDSYESRYRSLAFTRLQNYNAIERLSAGYIMAEINIGPRFMILPGVRYEHEHSEYGAVTGEVVANEASMTEDDLEMFFADTLALRNMGMWFPMVQARYKVTDWFDVRAARTVSASRPSFHHMSPRFSITYDGAEVRRGNTLIKPMRSTNYDLFLTFYTNRIGLFTLGGFTKSVENLIYSRSAKILDPLEMDLPENTRMFDIHEPVNSEFLTSVQGFEVEWQSNFTWLPVPFNGVVINANFSRFYSEAKYHSFERFWIPPRMEWLDTFRLAPMVHQADYIANLAVGYDYKGFSTRISMQYQGATLRSIGSRPELDRYTDAYLRFDASIRQRFYSNRFSIYANINNITNREDRSSQFTFDRPRSIEYYGTFIDIGLEFRF